jgi:hypothetical protein
MLFVHVFCSVITVVFNSDTKRKYRLDDAITLSVKQTVCRRPFLVSR